MPQLRFSEHPCSAHEHTPAEVFHIKACFIDDTECEAEQDRRQSGKQDKEGNERFQLIAVKDGMPDVSFIATINIIYHTGILMRPGRQLNAKLLPGISGRGGTEDVPAGRGLSGQTGTSGAVFDAENAINIKADILQRGANRERGR